MSTRPAPPEDLEVHGLLPDRSLQPADVLLRRTQFVRRYHGFVRRHGRLGAQRDREFLPLRHAARDPEFPAQLRKRQLATSQPGSLFTLESRSEQTAPIRTPGNALHDTLLDGVMLSLEGVSMNWGSEHHYMHAHQLRRRVAIGIRAGRAIVDA